MTLSSLDLAAAANTEEERAWQALFAAVSPAGRVYGPQRLLSKVGIPRKQALQLISSMEGRGWLRVDTSLKGVRAVYLIREPTRATPQTTVTHPHSTRPGYTSSEERRPLTERETDAVLYGDFLTNLLRWSFRHAYDGYVPLQTFTEKAAHCGLDKDTLGTLVAKGYCVTYFIQSGELTSPPHGQTARGVIVLVTDIPAPPPQGKRERPHPSASYNPPHTTPLQVSLPVRDLPAWHPFFKWRDLPAEMPGHAPISSEPATQETSPAEPTNLTDVSPTQGLNTDDEAAYRSLHWRRSRQRTDDGRPFVTQPLDVLYRSPPHLKGEPANQCLRRLQERGWIEIVPAGSSIYIVLLRP